LWRRIVAVVLDPLFDVIELEPQMTSKAVVGDGVAMTSGRPAVDERFRHSDQGRDLIDGQVGRDERELELLRNLRLPLSCHAVTLLAEPVKQSS
jgi:hypothetical protein